MTLPFTTHDGNVVLADPDGKAPVRIEGGISAQAFAVVHAWQDGYLWAGYLRDEKGIWWFHARNRKARFVTPDADAFRTLDDDYGLDSTAVYLEDRPIPDADPHTFALVPNSPYFAKDSHRLYVKGGSHFFHVNDIDVATLAANGPFVADKDNLFHHGEGLRLANDVREREHVQYSLHDEHDMRLKDWLLKHHGSVRGWWHPDYDAPAGEAEPLVADWYRSPQAVFFREVSTTMRGSDDVFHRLVGAQPGSFTVLDAHHARDAASVFCRWRRITGADPSSFEPLGGLFGRDAHAVYFNGYRVEGANPATFTAFRTARPYGKDGTRVYAGAFARTSRPFGHPDHVLAALESADPATFQAYGERGAWASDAGRVFLHGELKKKLDATSFRFLGETPTNSWAQDANGLYRANGTMVVAGIDGSTFRKRNDFWGADANVVFSFVTGAIQKSIDVGSFAVTDAQGGARDAGARYRIERGAIKKQRA